MLHVKFEFHSNRDTLTYFTAQNRSKPFICIHGLKNHMEASDLVHTLILWVSWSLLIFVMVGQFFGPLADKNTWKGVLLELPASEKFSGLFLYMLWDMNFKLGINIKWVVSHVKFEFHSNPDTLTYFTAIYLHSWLQKLYRYLRFGTHIQIVSVLTPVDFCHAWAIFGPLVGKNTQKGS